MKMTKLILVVLLTLGAASARAQLITTFGSSAENAGNWIYTPETSTISGNEGLGDVIYGTPENTSFLSGSSFISLTGSVVIAPSGSFHIVLEDSLGNLAGAIFFWSSFTGGMTTIQQQLSYTTFNFDDVVGWALVSGAGLIPEPVEASFSEMSAVPEPSAFTVIGLAGILIAARRRRRVRAF